MTEPATAPPPPQTQEPQPWGRARCWVFRFLLLYSLLYVTQDQMGLPLSLVSRVTGATSAVLAELEVEIPEPIADINEALGDASDWNDEAWEATVAFVGEHVFRKEGEIADLPSGSGDTTFDHYSMHTVALFAVLVATLWSLIDRRPRRHWRLLAWLTIVLRWQLALTMLVYGFMKAFPLQFLTPFPARMDQTFGDASPMGLLWTFMGASPGYTMFTGIIELAGGVLLLSRRTSTLGALVTAGAMANVAALNYFYDTPVKLLSTHMTAMATVLALLEWRRLCDFFIRNRSVEAQPLRTPFTGRWWPILTYPIKIAVIAATMYLGVKGGVDGLSSYGPFREKPPLSGLYAVETYAQDGEERPPLLEDEVRWRRVIIDGMFGRDYLQAWAMADGTSRIHASHNYTVEIDTEAKTVTLTPSGAPEGEEPEKFVLGYSEEPPASEPVPGDPAESSPPAEAEPAGHYLTLFGTLRGHEVRIVLRRKTESDFALTNRGFHWVSEYPHNR